MVLTDPAGPAGTLPIPLKPGAGPREQQRACCPVQLLEMKKASADLGCPEAMWG